MATDRAMKYKGKSIDDLLAEIDAAWNRLMDTMSAASEGGKVEAADPQGWTVLDHMAHVTAWERSVWFPLEGKSRHEAVNLTEEQFLQDIDSSNELIRAQTRGHTYEQVMADADESHQSLIADLRNSSLEELWKPALQLCPDDTDIGERPFIDVLMGDTSSHYDEHRGYISEILSASGG